MSDTRKDAPEFIYLQDGAHDGEIDGPSEYDSGEVTWSCTRIYGDDTKYIRHDKYITLTAELARVKADRDALVTEVGNKYPNETRFETALRYIRQAENQPMCAAADAARE